MSHLPRSSSGPPRGATSRRRPISPPNRNDPAIAPRDVGDRSGRAGEEHGAPRSGGTNALLESFDRGVRDGELALEPGHALRLQGDVLAQPRSLGTQRAELMARPRKSAAERHDLLDRCEEREPASRSSPKREGPSHAGARGAGSPPPRTRRHLGVHGQANFWMRSLFVSAT